jgi:hypothetical protein
MDETSIKSRSTTDLVCIPADVLDGCPHIIDLGRVADIISANGSKGIDLRAIDTIAMVLYKWKPDALKDLLDMSRNSFHWKFFSVSNFQWYLIRERKKVRVSKEKIKSVDITS